MLLTESEQHHEKQCGKMEWRLKVQILLLLSLATVSVCETLVEKSSGPLLFVLCAVFQKEKLSKFLVFVFRKNDRQINL